MTMNKIIHMLVIVCGTNGFVVRLFQTTTKYASRDLILQELEKLGGICDCQGSRYCDMCCQQ